MQAHDPKTLAFYDREASAYAARSQGSGLTRLHDFLDRLTPKARILELGCGGGRDAEAMTARGFDVMPTDGSPGLAAEAEKRLGRPVLVMRFEELEADTEFDAVWANACLLHVPMASLPAILKRIHRALKPRGLFFACFKAGGGEGRDRLGRFYNFPSVRSLSDAYDASGPWETVASNSNIGGGYDGVTREWLFRLVARA